MLSEYSVNVESGLIAPARQCAIPNKDARPDTAALSAVILHGISLPPGEYGGDAVESLFLNTIDWDAHPYFQEIRGMEVSAHLFIRRDGELIQFVPFSERAWHAGTSAFRGVDRCNDFSIGIELEGEDNTAYDSRQYPVIAGVLQALVDAYPGISVRDIAGHCDIAPGRKTDPGPAFDWLRLYDELGEQQEKQQCT